MRKKALSIMLILVLLAFSGISVSADVPLLIGFQGKLTDSSGTPVEGTRSITFTLYDASTGGTALWTETQSVQISKGIYNVLMGSATPINLSFDRDYWLGIKVGTDLEMTPRQRITSVGYAFRAKDADTVDGHEGSALEESGEIDADIAAHSADAGAHHIRYTDADAVSAIGASGVSSMQDGDGDTKIQVEESSDEDKIRFDTGGAERMVIDSNGSVGIGIASPATEFNVRGYTRIESATVPTIQLKRNGNVVANGNVEWLGSDGIVDWAIRANYEGTGHFSIREGDTDLVHINSGNVGIGTTSPAAKLDVGNGAVLFSGTTGVTPVEGAGIRLMWIPSKIAFRAGAVSGTQWDDENIGHQSTVTGGDDNIASGERTTVGGGTANTASRSWATIGGGSSNTASAVSATVGGGQNNTITDDYGTVGGGWNNQVGDNAGTTEDRAFATVAGGESNIASGERATVGGGSSNTASGPGSTVAGGVNNLAKGGYSFAAGRRAKANHMGAFVWGDGTEADVASSAYNQFTVRASGGVQIFTNGGLTAGVQVAAGGSSWSTVSDRNAKANFAPVDRRELLRRLATIPVQTWNYRAQDPSIRHIGPVAQDFHAAFGVGEDNKRITTIDADGVAMAAIQGLYRMVQEKEAQIDALQEQNTRIEARLAALEALVGGLTRLPAQSE